MDPKTLSQIDPQTPQDYNRVMGTSTTIDPQTDNPLSSVPPQEPQQAPSVIETTTQQTTTFQPTDLSTPPMPQNPFAAETAQQPMPSSFAPDPTPPQQMPDPTPPTDFSSNDLSSSIEPQPSIFSSSPQAPDAPVPQPAEQASSFFTNPSPEAESPMPSSQPPNSFNQLSPMDPPPSADTAMATDTNIPPTPVTPYNTPEQSAMDQQSNFTQPLPSPSDVVAANTPQETSALTKVIYIIAAVIFFAVYTIFWIKVFNLPFLF